MLFKFKKVQKKILYIHMKGLVNKSCLQEKKAVWLKFDYRCKGE